MASPAKQFWMSLDTNSKIFIGLMILMAVVFVFTSVLRMDATEGGGGGRRGGGGGRPPVGGKCSLKQAIPQLGHPRAILSSSPNDSYMAKLAGYIEVYNRGYLALDLSRMSYDWTRRVFVLEDDCVSVSIGVPPAGARASIGPLEWSFKIDASASEEANHPHATYRECQVSSPSFEHSFPIMSYRYSCLERQTHQCEKMEAAPHEVAQIVIESLELELYGDASKISYGLFSKPPYRDSCIR